MTFNPGLRKYSAEVPSLKGPEDISVSLANPQYGITRLKVATGNQITFDFAGRCASDNAIYLVSGTQERIIYVTTEGRIETPN